MVSVSDVSTVPKIACPSQVKEKYLGINNKKSYHTIL